MSVDSQLIEKNSFESVVSQDSARVRRALFDTPLWNTPFQLLPRLVYAAQDIERTLVWQSQFAATLASPPEFIVATTVTEETVESIWSLVASLAVQSYPHLRLVVSASDESCADIVRTVMSEYQVPGVVYSDQTKTLTEIIQLETHSPATYSALLPATSFLHPCSLFILAKQIARRSPDLIYTNEAFLNPSLVEATAFMRRAPVEKFTMLSMNTLGNLLVLSPRAVAKLAEFADECLPNGAVDFWIAAASILPAEAKRAFVPLALLHSRENVSSTKQNSERENERAEALIRYAKSVGISLAGVEFFEHRGERFARPIAQAVSAEIQVIVPYRNQSEMTIRCLESLLKQDSLSQIHLTLVDNGSDESERAKITAFLKDSVFGKITHITDSGYFNYAQLNNLGAARGNEPFILFLNNDVVLETAETLSELRSWGAVDDVGAVGGLLRYPSGKIQHAGINFLSVRPANIATENYFPFIMREVNAVTFAMALVKRKAFDAVGGLDEFLCPNGFGDALFCSELRKRGYRSLFTPVAIATHHESQSRGSGPEELELLELTQVGLPIADLYPDFYAELQPMKIETKALDISPFTRVVDRIQRSPRLLAKVNSICRVALAPLRFWKRL